MSEILNILGDIPISTALREQIAFFEEHKESLKKEAARLEDENAKLECQVKTAKALRDGLNNSAQLPSGKIDSRSTDAASERKVVVPRGHWPFTLNTVHSVMVPDRLLPLKKCAMALDKLVSFGPGYKLCLTLTKLSYKSGIFFFQLFDFLCERLYPIFKKRNSLSHDSGEGNLTEKIK